MSIQNLIDTYKGNPAPLANKVQQDMRAQQSQQPQQGPQGQRAQPSGAIPPDLEQAMALQQIQELQQAAQAQQAMQAGGPQPTIVQKLQQLLGHAPMQGQPQGMMPQGPQGQPQGGPPQGQPQPQGIHQLPTNIGQHLAGGGIVAFAAGDAVDESDDLPDWARGLRANRLARQRAMEEERARNMAQVNASGVSEGRSANVPRNDLLTAPAEESVGAGPRDDPMRDLVSRLHSQRAPAPRPPVAQAPAPIPRPPVAAAPSAPSAPTGQPAQQGLGALLEQNIRADLGRDRDVEAQKMLEKQRDISGMSDYQKQMLDMVTRREAAQKEAQSNRTPEWVRGLQALGGAPIRGGLGMVLAQAGRGATAARDAYGEEDMKFANELDTLRKAAMDAQLRGNMDLAKTYADQYREVDSARRAAMTSGTSLENTRVNDATRRQNAMDAAAARAQAERFRHEDRATAAADRSTAAGERMDAQYREQAMRLAMTAAVKEKESPANFARLRDVSAEELAARKFDAIYNALKTGKMSAAPGAGSPGGTSTSGWGKAQVVK